MASKLTIEISANFSSKGGAELRTLEKLLDSLDKKIARLDKAHARPKIEVKSDSFEKKIDDVESKTKRLGQTKASARLEAIDNASKKIGAVMAKAERIGAKAFRFGLDVVDGATQTIGTVGSAVKGLAGGVYNVTVGLIDKITAPVRNIIGGLNSILGMVDFNLGGHGLVAKPIEMQVDYENLTTAFDVLLGDADKAQQRIDDLTSFAGKTPFTRDEIYASNRTLEVYSKGAISSDPEQRGGMKMAGDIAAGVNGDYQNVAKWLGRLYSSMKGGGPVGEMTAAFQDMGALDGVEGATIEKLSESVGSGAMGIEEAWDGVAEVFSRFDGTMEKQSNKLGNLLLGVKSFINNNLLKKLGAGFSEGLTPFLKDFRSWRSSNADLIAGWAEQIQGFASTITSKATVAVKGLAENVSDMMSSTEWGAASFAGKINIAWATLVAEPFASWWNSSGKHSISSAIGDMGQGIGEGISNGILFLLGIDSGAVLEDGSNMGAAFIQGFKSKFDGDGIAYEFRRAISNLPDTVANIWEKVKGGFTSLKETFREVFFNPLSDWWGSGGKESIVSGAAQLGSWLGEGITKGVEFLSGGLLSLLGVDTGGMFSEAADVGSSFWDAFADSFDGGRISSAIANAIGGVWSVLPGWAKVLVGGKMLSGVSSLVSGARSTLDILGSASKGSGLLGAGAKAVSGIKTGASGFAKGAYDISQDIGFKEGSGAAYGIGQRLFGLGTSLGATGSGLSVALQGAGALGGAVVGAGTLISGGMDIYKATQSDGSEGMYNAVKGGSKLAGVGLGALIGTAILPGLGTLIGAGVGGLAGAFGGEKLARSTSGYDEDDIRRVQELDAAMQGYSESSRIAARQSTLTASDMENIKRTKLDEWFGDVSLSMNEISKRGQQAFNRAMGAKNIALMSEYSKVSQSAEEDLQDINSSSRQLKSKKYKLELGMSLSQTDSHAYTSIVGEYISSVQSFASNRRYEVEIAADFILGENSSFGKELDAHYAGIEAEANGINEKIRETIQNALSEDDDTPFEIDFDEQQIIDQYLSELTSLYEKIDKAEQQAKLTSLKSRYGGPGEITKESRDQLFSEYDQIEQGGVDLAYSQAERLWSANNLINEPGTTQHKERETEIQSGLESKIEALHQGMLKEKLPYYEAEGQKVASDISETNAGVNDALLSGFQAENFKSLTMNAWDTQDWYESLLGSFDTDELTGIIAAMKAEADLSKQQLLEIQDMYNELGIEPQEWLSDGLTSADEIINLDNIDITSIDPSVLWSQIAEVFESSGDVDFAETIRTKITDGSFEEAINGGMGELDLSNAGNVFDESLGGAIDNAPTAATEAALVAHRVGTEAIAQAKYADPINVTATVNVNYKTNHIGMPKLGPASSGGYPYDPLVIGRNAIGRIVSGKQLSWIGEEGPEAIIPLVPGRRDRALSLWKETGKRLGVLENVDLSTAGGNISQFPTVGNFGEVTSAVQGFGEIPPPIYEVVSVQQQNGGGASVVLQNGSVQIVIQVADGQSVTAAIDENLEEIGAKVAGKIAEKMQDQYRNTPAKKEA